MPNPRSRRIAIAGATAFVLGLVGALTAASPAMAATLTVTSNADSGAGSLRAVVAAAASGDTIEFDPGISTIALLSTITVATGITIDGGDDVTLTRGTASSFLMLYFGPSSVVADQDYVLRDITLDGSGGTGAAISASYGTGNVPPRDITLSGVVVRDMTSVYAAIGDFYQVRGDMLIEESSFIDNVSTGTSSSSWGGFYIDSNPTAAATVIVRDSTFLGNDTAFRGGAISYFNSNSSLVIEDSTFEGNSADKTGGALHIESDTGSGSVTITGSTFTDNSAGENGGAIGSGSVGNGLSVTNSTFSGSSAQEGAAAMYIQDVPSGSPLTIESSTFSGSSNGLTPTLPGIAIAVETLGGSLTVHNVTADERASADSGAPLYIGATAGDVVVRSSTLGGPAAAVSFGAANSGALTIINSALETEAAGAGQAVTKDSGAASVSVSYSATNTSLGAATAGSGVQTSVSSLGLGDLAANGGPTYTRLPQTGSPLINQGDPAGAGPLTTDQRGLDRVVGSAVDVGAVEIADETAPVYRFWSSTKKSHFYTISASERDFVIANYDDAEWAYEGASYDAYPDTVAGSEPLFRFWSERYQGHFYTADETERDFVIASYPDDEWLYEGVAYYILPSGAGPGSQSVARFWSQQNRRHFYTADAAERDFVIANYDDFVWQYEGTAFNVPTG